MLRISPVANRAGAPTARVPNMTIESELLRSE
jgi:hypothetical protein